MIGWLRLSDEQRRVAIEQAFIRSNIAEKAIEKDWWVTLTLKVLFSMPQSEHFIFKGGTSLSKGWKLIKRFSEDVDIALAPEAFGREYKKQPSHSYVKTLKKEGCSFTSTVLKEALEKQLEAMGVSGDIVTVVAAPVPETLPDRDPQTLHVRYKSLYPPNSYLADEVKIEFGVRSLKEPFATVSIQSLLSEMFPNPAYQEEPFEVIAVEPRKTFLEKTILLHEKFSTKDTDNINLERQSRHLYDLVSMMGTAAEKLAITDIDFFSVLIEHRKNYIRLKGIDYSQLKPAVLSFIPPDDMLELFRQDYATMRQQMIYGDSLEFDALIDQLRLLNGRFKIIGDGRKNSNETAKPVEKNTGILQEHPTTEPYKNLGGASGVTAYKIGLDYIRVKFNTGSVYQYSYRKARREHVEQMKILARGGKGLNTYINKFVKKLYD